MPNPIRMTVLADGDSARLALSKVVSAGSAAVTALAAVGVAAAREAVAQEAQVGRAAAALGSTAKEQARLAKTSSRLYQDAYGESFEEVTRSVEAVQSSFRGLGEGRELEKLTAQALDVSKTFEFDLPRAVSVAKTAVSSGLAEDATQALDLITASSQRVPAALRESVLDAAAEYAPFFADLGFTGEQAFATIVAGAKKGEIGIDKTADAVKEFSIRSTDLSTGTAAAYDRIGLNSERMADRILAGGDSARRATSQIIDGLLDIESPSKRAESAIALFGTPIEDLSVTQIPSFLRSLQAGQRGLGNFEGAADRAGKTLNNNTGTRLLEFRRKVTQTIVEEIGQRALPILDDLAESGIKVIEAFKADGLDGAASALEELTGTQGKLTPILDDGRDALESVLRVVEVLGPAALDAVSGLGPLASPLNLIDEAASAVAAILEALPDGLIVVGVQAAILARVLPLLTGATAAAGGAFVTTRARLAQMRAEMSYATTAVGRGRVAMSYMGGAAKQAAGIGGLLALSAGLGNASDEGNSLKSTMQGVAGGAGIGFMLGGPIGALIGGAAGGGLTALAGAFAETAEEAEDARRALLRSEGFANAKADADDLRTALVGVINTYGKVSRAAVEANFTGPDGLEEDVAKLRRLGVSMDTIVSATLGQADAQRIVDEKLGRNIGGLQERVNETRIAYERLRDQVVEVQNLPGQVPERATADPAKIEEARQAYEDANRALENSTRQQALFSGRIRETSGALEDHRSVVRQVASDLGITVAEYQRFPAAVRTEFEGEGLRQTTDGALRLIEEYEGLQSFDRIRAIISAPGVDLTARQTRALLEQYRLTPKDVKTRFEAAGITRTADGAVRLIKRYGELQSFERIRAVVSAPGVDLTVGQIRTLQNRYRLTPKQVRTLVNIEGVEVSDRKLDKLLRSARDVDRSRPRARVDVDTRDAERSLRTLGGLVQDAGRIRASASVDVDTRDAVRSLDRFGDEMRSSLRSAEGVARSGGQEVARSLEEPVRGARADLGQFGASITSGVSSVRGRASTGGREVGAALQAGVIAGFGGTSAQLAAQATAAVSNAIAAARARARINSPSKETEYIGRMLGEGLPLGLRKEHKNAAKAGRDLIEAALSGTRVRNGSQGVSAGLSALGEEVASVFERRTRDAEKSAERRTRIAEGASAEELRQIQKSAREDLVATKARLRERLKGEKLDKAIRRAEEDSEKAQRRAEREAEAALQQRLKTIRTTSRDRLAAIAAESKAAQSLIREEDDRLRANAKRQDLVGERLRKQTERLKGLRDEAKQYAAAIRDSFVSYGSVVGLGVLEGEDESVSSSLLTDQLEGRVARAKEFAALIRSFRDDDGPKLNDTTLQELIDKGPEAALATASAIASGGAATIREINDLTDDLAEAGKGLGADMVKEFHQAGIDAAVGIVDGLRAKDRELDKAAERLARNLVRKVKAELGIASPSKAFRGIADDTTDGLLGRLKENETHVKRQGADLAKALQVGFADPELIAQAKATGVATAAGTGAGAPVVINNYVTVTVPVGASPVAVAKAVSEQLDLARTAGVRRVAMGGR